MNKKTRYDIQSELTFFLSVIFLRKEVEISYSFLDFFPLFFQCFLNK